VSGLLIDPEVKLEILDQKGMPILTDTESVAELVPLNSNEVELLKSKSVIAANGTFTFNDVIVIASPGTDILLKVSVNSISKTKIEKAFPMR
jgi:hypothetical protein